MGAAAGLFAEHGFAGVSVDDIGATVGVSGPALYHHFQSKEALLGEMLVDISVSLRDQAQQIEASRPAADVLEALVAMHVDFAVDRRALITVQMRDLVHASPADQRRVRELQGAYVDIWERALLERRPAIGGRTARACVHACFGLVNSTPFSGRLNRAAMVDLLRTMAMGALSSVESPAGALGPSGTGSPVAASQPM